ncbi:hypothetical protein N657DRAFT_674257 [Parathielavia appendiculata]|uniref:Uncharacterized protein n=1 Tax=Parathielavia appendiculata TaxID=2587402 RepID=A0AAN6TTA6_9PEZI|nr:hypothetical protein N657DRAFT_674257 [Parathielavia appendiculata]
MISSISPLFFRPLLLQLLLLSTTGSTQTHPLPSESPSLSPAKLPVAITSRQPTPNPLDFLNLRASQVYASPDRVPQEEACGAGMVYGMLGFPHARFTADGHDSGLVGELQVECFQGLVFEGLPVGYAFSVLAVEVEGMLQVERGAWLDRVEVEVEYFGGEGPGQSNTTVTDKGSDLKLRPRFQGPYSGAFSLLVNVFSEDGTSRTTRGRTTCPTEDSKREMAVRFRLSSMHDPTDVGNGIKYRATVSDVRVGFHVMWVRCEN